MKDTSVMKSKSRARSVTTEIFFVYFFGYVMISLVIFISVHFSFKIYEVACSIRTYNKEYFETLEKKIDTDYRLITESEIKEIDGFIIKINNDNKIEYSIGNLRKEKLQDLKLEEFMSLFEFEVESSEFKVKNNDILSRNVFKHYSNIVITMNNGEKLSIYAKYMETDKSVLIIGCPYSEITKPNVLTQIIPHPYIVKFLVFSNVMIVLFIVYILAQKTSKEFINPIRTLLKGVIEISNGNYDVRVKSEKINEFLELSNGFNNMAETIQNEQKENKKLEKMREDLILDISHDLKNPLASIMGYSETLINAEDLTNDKINEYLTIINRNSYRANKLINDLFEFSLYNNTDYKFNLEKRDICEMLREIIANFIPEFDHKEFTYDFDIFESSYYVMADEEKIYRAINNILDNKVKYNKKGNTISIRTEIHDNRFFIKFCDNGDSIPDQYKESIFNPFVRVDKSRNSKTGGTGLGLSITKRILNKHNGDIRILDSKVGTNFEVYLPLIKTDN